MENESPRELWTLKMACHDWDSQVSKKKRGVGKSTEQKD